MADHFELSLDDEYDIFEDAEDGLSDRPPSSGPVSPSDGGDLAVPTGLSGPGLLVAGPSGPGPSVAGLSGPGPSGAGPSGTGLSGTGPLGARPKVPPPVELVTVANLSDDESSDEHPLELVTVAEHRSGRQPKNRKRNRTRTCLLQWCSQRMHGDGMAGALKHFTPVHLPPGPWTAGFSLRILDCLCAILGVNGLKGLMRRVRGHPFLKTGFKLSEEDRSVAAGVANLLRSRLPPMSSVVAGFARGVVLHPGYLTHPRVLVALMRGFSEAQCLTVRNLSPGPAPDPPSEAPRDLVVVLPAGPGTAQQSPLEGLRRTVARTRCRWHRTCPLLPRGAGAAEEVAVGLYRPHPGLSLTVRLGTWKTHPRGNCHPR
jgi:hypothetical protein